MASDIIDVAVIGGGPAGAMAAAKLSQAGFDVVMIDDNKPLIRMEGLGERLLHWFDTQGLGASVRDIATYVPRTAYWGGINISSNHEYLVERTKLDALLRQYAVSQGVKYHEGQGYFSDSSTDLEIRVSSGHCFLPRYSLDARGRKAHLQQSPTRGPATIAIGGWFQEDPACAPYACVCPIPEGWVWVAAPGNGALWVQATLDAAASEGRPEQRLVKALEAASPPLKLSVSPNPTGVIARDCAPILPTKEINPFILPVGDASAGMDPLSGHGIFWAVSGALAAVSSILTLENAPSAKSEDLVKTFMEKRIRETYWRQARLGRDFLRQETRFSDFPFWQKRLHFPDNVPVHDRQKIEIQTTILPNNGVLKECEVLITPKEPSGVAWFGDIPAVEAYRLYCSKTPQQSLVSRWGQKNADHLIKWFEERISAG